MSERQTEITKEIKIFEKALKNIKEIENYTMEKMNTIEIKKIKKMKEINILQAIIKTKEKGPSDRSINILLITMIKHGYNIKIPKEGKEKEKEMDNMLATLTWHMTTTMTHKDSTGILKEIIDKLKEIKKEEKE